jgi:hypothetical protein
MAKTPEELAKEAQRLEVKEVVKEAVAELFEEWRKNPPAGTQQTAPPQDKRARSLFAEFFGIE